MAASSTSFGAHNSGFEAAVIHGSVHTQFYHYAPPKRRETPPNPSAIIPFPRDVDFVERGTLLDQIEQRCGIPGSRVAIVGLGGVGKSQLAIEYAYRIRNQSPDTWVFWVHASNASRFEQSFQEIADRVKILGRKDPIASILQLVYEWLCDEKKGKWVLILDNVDNASFLIKAPSPAQDSQAVGVDSKNSRPLVAYLPYCLHGSILVTTRSRSAALELVEPRDVISVGPMNDKDALALFNKKSGGQHDQNTSTELVVALEFMPLAIVQAAAYISQRVPRYSECQYLEDFQKDERKRTSLLNHAGQQLRRDQEAANSIIITWQISFDHIREIRPSAADLLSLMSFFDRQGIPETLLQRKEDRPDLRQDQNATADGHRASVISGNGDGDRDDDDDDSSNSDSQSSMTNEGFEQDIMTLRDYYLISVNPDGATFEMHALVQLATREWLKAHHQQERWKQQSIKNLNAELATGEYENWPTCQALFPHAQAALAQKPTEQYSRKEWATVMYKAAWYAWRMGRGDEAEKMSLQALKVRSEASDRDHKETLKCMSMVGLAYNLKGQWSAAEDLFVQVIETSKTRLGAEHPFTLTSMANLASTNKNQGQWQSAEELEVQVMETLKKKLGDDHPDTLASMANLASTHRNQGRWDAAKELEVQVINTFKKRLGADHPSTLTSMANLASTYRNQGRWDVAEELEMQVMETFKKKLGAEHPSTLTSMANLASTYWNQGRWDIAKELEVQVMETFKKKLGAEHPSTLTSMANLASTYCSQGQWDIAEELEVQVMETRRKKFGVDHPSTLTSMNNLAFTWKVSGQATEAIRLMEECVQAQKRVFGLNHPDTLSSCTALQTWKAEQEHVKLLA